MRRHRVYEHELPAVKASLHWYLKTQCESPPWDEDQNIIHAFRLYYRIISYRRNINGVASGMPDYPSILDEKSQIQYNTIMSYLESAEESDPDLHIMVPFLRGMENIIPSEITEIMPVWPRADNLLTSSFIGADEEAER